MNTRKTEKTTNSRLFNKGVLPVAVATAMFGAGVASAADFYLTDDATITDLTSSYNATTDYIVNANSTLSTNSSMTVYYGTIDGTSGTDAGGTVTIGGNLTMHGNIGATNATGNFTISNGNTLTLASNVSTFNSDNMTLNASSTLNLGNTTTGYNRGTSEALVFSSNISMGSASTINVGNGTTLSGAIYGASDGVGTLNIHGNVTSGGVIGGDTKVNVLASDLAVVTVHTGNTFTLSHESSVTNYYINGTLTNGVGLTGNMTGNVNMGTSGILNLNNLAGEDTTARVKGRIDGAASGYGTLNINGTYTTGGQIGRDYKLAAINLDSGDSPTSHTYTFAHNVNATTITLGTNNAQSGNTTLAISTAITVTGDIVSSGNASAAGILDINENTIFVDNIGTSSAALERFTIATGKTATFKDSIYSGNITLETAGVASTSAALAFNGTANTAYTVTGKIDGQEFGHGSITVNTGNVTFSSAIGSNMDLNTVTVADNAEMAISNNISTNGTVSIVGTLDINSAVTLHTGGISIGSNAETGSTLELSNTLTLSSDTITTASGGANMAFNNATIRLNGTHSSHAALGSGYIDIGTNNGTVTIQGNTTIDLDLTNTVITDGATIVIVGRGSESNSNGTLNVSGNISFTGYQMFTLESNNSTVGAWSTGYGADESNKSLNATVTYRTSSAMGFTGNTQAVYDSAKTAIAADTAVFQALAGLTTDAALKSAIATMHPATGGAEAASASISGSSMSTAGTRMAYTRQTGLGKGMNAGGATLDESMWVQIFGANVDQDNVSGISGYDADGQGLAIGIDGLSADGTTRIGIAGSFANTDVTGKDSTTKTTTDIDTTQVMVYANKDYADGMYVEGVASYAFNDNTGTRRILVGAVDRTASSAYDSGVFAVNVEAGWPKENNGVTITPTLGLAYSHLSSDAYTETGAAGMNLTVTPGDVSTFEGKAGVKITGKSVDADGGIGRPEFRIGVTHNFGDKTADSTATFTAGGSSFTTKGVETDTTKLDLGLGYTYTTPEGDTEISVNADGRQSDSYLQYGGGLTVKWKF